MKDQPLPLNSAVDLWPWAHFSLGLLTSFGRLFRLRCFALSSRVCLMCEPASQASHASQAASHASHASQGASHASHGFNVKKNIK